MRLLRKFVTDQFLLDKKRGRIALVLPTSDFRIIKLRWLYPDREESVSLRPGTTRDCKKLLRVKRFKPLVLQHYQQLPSAAPTRIVKIVRTLDCVEVLLETLLIPPDFLEPSAEFLNKELPEIAKVEKIEQISVERKNVGNIQKILVRFWN